MSDLAERARRAFADDLRDDPPMSLRSGNAVDSYDLPIPFDPEIDRNDETYIETYAFFAIPHLDPVSWRHYLAPMVDYALRHRHEPGDLAVESFLWSLRPPDRDPPRLASLTDEQAAVVTSFLEVMALDDASEYVDDAIRALEEWWAADG